MATFKTEVHLHRKKKDGTYNIKIRVTHKQKKKYLSTPFFVSEKEVTRTGKIKNQHYLDACEDEIRRYRKICDSVGFKIETMTVDQITDLIKAGEAGDNFDLDFVQFGREYAASLENRGNARTYTVALNSLIRFTGREQISVHEITTKFVKDWVAWIKNNPARGNAKTNRAQSLYSANIRALHNVAKNTYNDEDSGIIRIPLSPFRNVKIEKFHASRQRSIDVETLRMIATLQYTETHKDRTNIFNLAKDLFILSFALVGMNAADLYECTDIKNDRITYNRKKTRNRRSDNALISIKIEPEIMPLVQKYRDTTGARVFKFYQMYSTCNTFQYAINRGLKQIGNIVGADDLEFYAARHTWATIASNSAGVDKYTIHTALNHVIQEMKVTEMYIKKDWQVIDKANRTVLDYVKLVNIPTQK